MATLDKNMQSYLEKEAIDNRREQMARSDYGDDNEYNERNEDALATGDEKGKGTGNFGGHGWIAPDMTKPISQMSPMFNTEEGGNNCDNAARDVMTQRSIYGPGREYSIDYVVDTTANRMEGQYDGAERIRVPYMCPVF